MDLGRRQCGAPRFAQPHRPVCGHRRFGRAHPGEASGQFTDRSARSVHLVVVRVVDDLPLRNVPGCHLGELLQQHGREGEVAAREDAAPPLASDPIDSREVVIRKPGTSHHDMGSPFECVQDVSSGSPRLRVLDEDVARMGQRFCNRPVDGADEVWLTQYLAQVPTRVRARHAGHERQVRSSRDGTRQFGPREAYPDGHRSHPGRVLTVTWGRAVLGLSPRVCPQTSRLLPDVTESCWTLSPDRKHNHRDRIVEIVVRSGADRLKALTEPGEIDYLHRSGRAAWRITQQRPDAVDPRIRGNGGVETGCVFGVARIPKTRKDPRAHLGSHRTSHADTMGSRPPSCRRVGSAGPRTNGSSRPSCPSVVSLPGE